MAYYGYPSHPFCLPWGFEPSPLVSPDPTFPPYPQDFVIPPGYGWIPGPMMPIMPFEFDLAFLSPSYCRAHAFFLQQYAYHYPPPPAPAHTQANDFVHMGIPLAPAGFPVVPVQPPYLQEVAAAGTGVFYPLVNNNNSYRARRRRGYATGRWRRNRHRRQEASRDAGASSQNNTSGMSSSQARKRR